MPHLVRLPTLACSRPQLATLRRAVPRRAVPRRVHLRWVTAAVFLPLAVRAQDAPWPRGTLIVSNMNDSTATIIDAATGRVRATVRTGAGPHEVAASHDGRLAIVSNYGVRGAPGHTLTVIDVARAAVARTIDLGHYRRPHGMHFLPGDTLLAVTAETDQAVLILDLRTDRIVRTLPTGARVSHMLAVPAAGDRIFTANIAEGSVSVLDPADTTAGRTVAVSRATEAIGVAPDGRRVWVGSNQDSVVVVLDPNDVARRDTLRGFGMPYRIVVTPDGRRAVISDPMRGEIRIVDAGTLVEQARIAVPRDSLLPTAEVPGSPSPEGVAVSTDSRWAFVTLQGRNRVVWVDLERGVIARSAPTGTWSDGVAFSPAPETAPVRARVRTPAPAPAPALAPAPAPAPALAPVATLGRSHAPLVAPLVAPLAVPARAVLRTFRPE